MVLKPKARNIHSLFLKFFSDFCLSGCYKRNYIHTVQIALSLFPVVSDRDTKMTVLYWRLAAVALNSLLDHWKSTVSNISLPAGSMWLLLFSHYRERDHLTYPFELSSTLLPGSWCRVSPTDMKAKPFLCPLFGSGTYYAAFVHLSRFKQEQKVYLNASRWCGDAVSLCPFVGMFSRTHNCFHIRWSKDPWLVLTLVFQCDSSSCACKFYFLVFCFLLKGTGGGGTRLCKCYDCKGERCISNFVIVIYFQYFYIFGFCKMSLTFVGVRRSRNMYIKCSYVQILCLVSYMLRLFFQKITWIYAN